MPDRPVEGSNLLNETVGPFYEAESVMSMLNIDEAALTDKINSHELLCCMSADNVRLFPIFQFHNGELVPAISEVLQILAGGADAPWWWALWLLAPMPEYHGLTAAEWLKDGRDPVNILADARADAYVWAH